MRTDPRAVLLAHVARFNDAVRSGDFSRMVAGFTQEAEMVFDGVPVGPFAGRTAIREAYERQPPTDEILLLGRPRVDGDTVESDYGWVAEGRPAGRMIITAHGESVVRLVVTFE